jgi:hypothetical protein
MSVNTHLQLLATRTAPARLVAPHRFALDAFRFMNASGMLVYDPGAASLVLLASSDADQLFPVLRCGADGSHVEWGRQALFARALVEKRNGCQDTVSLERVLALDE